MVAAWVVWLCGSRSVVLGWSASLLYRYLSLVAAVVGLLSWDGFGRGLVDFSIGFAVMGNGFADRHGRMARWRSAWWIFDFWRCGCCRRDRHFFFFFFFLMVIMWWLFLVDVVVVGGFWRLLCVFFFFFLLWWLFLVVMAVVGGGFGGLSFGFAGIGGRFAGLSGGFARM